MNPSNVLPNARNLTREAPRSARVRLGGYVILARTIDKGRATVNGTAGEYHFNCPLDRTLFEFKGIDGDSLKEILASGAGDEEVVEWANTHGTSKSPEEIREWSNATEAVSFYNVPDKKEWFVEECARLGLDPAKTTLFDYLEEDDRASFRQ